MVSFLDYAYLPAEENWGGGSRYSPRERMAPSRPARVIIAPRRSMFRDAMAVAGGVTVGSAMGHVAGNAISSLFSGRQREEVAQALPRGYDGSESGPCEYEIQQFLNCAQSRDLSECQEFKQALVECKRRNRIP